MVASYAVASYVTVTGRSCSAVWCLTVEDGGECEEQEYHHAYVLGAALRLRSSTLATRSRYARIWRLLSMLAIGRGQNFRIQHVITCIFLRPA